jgi:Zn-finger nucleic acid-binding protein
MNCPNCRFALVNSNYKGVNLDSCKKCGGVWFDRDELRIAKDRTDADMRWLDFDPFSFKNIKHLASDKKCPKCQINMHQCVYEKSRVLIDICPNCQGVWLDIGELDKIIKHLQKEIVTKSTADYLNATVEEFKEILTGPENITSEIRDFLMVVKFLELRYYVKHPWIIKLSDAINLYWPIK